MLVAFDFDGTLSADEMVVLLGERAGRGAEIKEITRRAMAGELGYAESLRERVALLEGVTEAEAAAAFEAVNLRDGAAAVFAALSEAGTRTAVLTGGFEAGVESALSRAGVEVDRVVANRLGVEDGRLTGEVRGPLVEGDKGDALRKVASAFGLDAAEAVAVGDGANDVPMLDAAGTAVGFRPKPGVAPHCDVVVEDMDGLLDALREVGAAGPG